MKLTKLFTLVSMLCLFVAAAVQADVACYRNDFAFAGSTNITWTVGRFEKPRLTAIEFVGASAGTNIVLLSYGDTAGGTRTLCTVTNGISAATSNTLTTFTSPMPDLLSGDVVTVGFGSTTNGWVRFHIENRATKPLN